MFYWLEFDICTNLVGYGSRSAVSQVCACPFRIETIVAGEAERIKYVYVKA